MNTADEVIGQWVAARREALGYSQTSLSKHLMELGLSNAHQTWVSRVESGKQPLRLTDSMVVATALNCTIDELISGVEPAEDPHLLRSGVEMSIKALQELAEKLR